MGSMNVSAANGLEATLTRRNWLAAACAAWSGLLSRWSAANELSELWYVAPVELNDSGNIKPGNLRERIRLHGVTIDLPVPA